MRYRFPFSYRHEFLIRGNRKPSSRYLIDHVDVDIPEISSSEAPTVAEWDFTVHRPFEGAYRLPLTNHVRSYGGRFLLPAVSEDSTRMAEGMRKEDLPVAGRSSKAAAGDIASMMDHWDQGRYYPPLKSYLVSGDRQKPVEPPRIAVDLGSDYARMREKAAENALGLVIVDGLVYRTVHEPTLKAVLLPSRVPEADIHTGSPHYNPNHNYSRRIRGPRETLLYRLTDLEAFLDEYRRLAADFPGEAAVGFDAVRVVDPDAFSFSREENIAARTLGHIVGEYDREPIGNWRADGIDAFVKLREAYRSYLAGAGEADVETLLAEADRVVRRGVRNLDERYLDFLLNMEVVSANPSAIGLAVNRNGPRP